MIEIRKTDQAIFLDLTENLVSPQQAENLKEVLHGLLEEGTPDVILNFSQVDHVNQRSWGIIAAYARMLRPEGKDLKLVGLDPLLEKEIKTVHLKDVLESYHTEEDALASFTGNVSQVERNVLFGFK